MNFGIIADDFTGANDVGLQLVKYGIKVESILELTELSGNFIYSTETRNSSVEEAKEKLREVFSLVKNNKIEKIYKKIDSTLRGNIKAEVEVLLEFLSENEKIAVVLPLPKLGRVVKAGKLWIKGVELKETEFAKDPFWKLESSCMIDYFNGEIVSLDEIRSPKLGEILEKKQSKVLIFEGETEEDLDKISKTLVTQKMDKYIVGSSGIMEFLLSDWGYKKEKILIVSGSCNPINIKQTKLFIESYKPTILEYDVNKDVDSIVEGSEVYLLRTIREGEIRSLKSSEEIKIGIAHKVKKICEEQKITKIVMSGGDISILFMKIYGIKKLEILAEIEHGIAFGVFDSWRIITKPGGFGSEKIYEKMYSFLKNYR